MRKATRLVGPLTPVTGSSADPDVPSALRASGLRVVTTSAGAP